MKTLFIYAKELGATSVTKVVGPNGAFISCNKNDGSKFTIPVGGNSQNGKLEDYKMFMTPDGVGIATVNEYKAVESMSLTNISTKKEELV